MSKVRTVSEAVAEFLASCEASADRSQHTIRAYQLDLQQFADHLPTSRPLTRLTVADIESWLAELSGRDYAPASRRRKLASVRLLLNHFVRRGTLENSPLAHTQIRIPLPDRLPRALELTDARALVKVVRDAAKRKPADPLRLRDRVIVEVLLLTGIRVGELVSLRRCDYLHDHQALRIQGKGNRERLALLLDESSREAVRRLLGIDGNLAASTAPLFLNQQGLRLTEQGVSYILRRSCKKAGIQISVTPHMLRHTAATLLLINGADIRLVQDFLGHSSIATTQLYTKLAPTRFRQALDKHHHANLLSE